MFQLLTTRLPVRLALAATTLVRRVLQGGCLGAFLACAAHGQPPAQALANAPLLKREPVVASVPVQRLADAARLWSRLQWEHPTLADGSVDWDRALLTALPAIAAAESPSAMRAAVLQLLQPLQDPAVRVQSTYEPRYVQAGEDLPPVQWLPGRVALLNLHRPISYWSDDFDDRLSDTMDAIQGARAVVVDLRPAAWPRANPADLLDRLLPQMVTKPLQLPSHRHRLQSGYPPQRGWTSGDYYAAWIVRSSRSILPDPKARPVPMAFIVNEVTPIPLSVLALHKAGLAYLLTEGRPDLSWVAPTQEVQMAAGLVVRFASGQLIYPDGSTGVGTDRVLSPSARTGPASPAVQAALKLVSSGAKPGHGVVWRSLAPLPRWAPDRRYQEPSLPDLGLRRLAVIRMWSVMDAFFPYRALMDQPWNDALPEFLERIEGVKTDRDYARTIAEMAARLQDNHVRVSGGASWKVHGEAALPLSLTMVEGKVVVAVLPDAGQARPLQLWDEVLEIDGEPVSQAIDRLAPTVASANPWTRDQVVLGSALGRGDEGSLARVKFKDASGRESEATLRRSGDLYMPWFPSRSGNVIRVLPGDIGYADLARLTRAQVDELFDRVQATKALILDMRGYPNGTAWAIAPRLNVKGAHLGALISPNLRIGGYSQLEQMRAVSVQPLPAGDGKPLYKGKVLMLINEQTISQAEHSGLMFEVACDLTYVGSPSAGSNGDVSNLVLPGGLRVSFTGQSIRHADGRELQRVGLQPQVPVVPTLEGLRAGRDEVLERAIQHVESGR